MKIKWYGLSCFNVKTKKANILIDPFNSKVGLKPPRLKVDLLLISRDDKEHNNKKSATGKPYVIDSPGEYELHNVFVFGIRGFTDEKKKSKQPLTMFLIQSEGITIGHLSNINCVPSEKYLERLENVDILFVPVGGKNTLEAEQATKIISEIEPRIVVPMYYKTPKLKVDLESADKFVREMGLKEREVIDSLNIKKKDLPQEETKVFLLKP
ncbi:MAG: MBL fold metallo-hydrolase [Patescibacteria group bacterium]|nr:MBL fold metallo-hydrolase [Patescibacteria group bacterium]